MAFNAFFVEMILPFLLVFVVVFAILQKSKILGDNVTQINSMTALIIGLIVIGLPASRSFIIDFLPWLAVGLAVMLVFFILYGFVAGDLSGSNMPKGFKITFGILAGLFTIGILLYVTGLWDVLRYYLGDAEDFWTTVVFIVLTVGTVLVVVRSGKKGNGSESS